MITIAPKGNTAPADVRLDGKTDMAVLAKYVTQAGADVKILKGIVNLNGGGSGDPSGGGYLRPGKGATITGEPGTVLEARSSIVRLTLDKPGVTLRQLSFKGRGHIQWFDTGSGSLLEDVTVDQSDDNGNHIDLKGNCTAGFLFYAKVGKTLKNVTLRRCTATKTYHHGFSMHVYGAQEGATFSDFEFIGCKALSCGMHNRAPRNGACGKVDLRNWAVGFNTADTGNVIRVHLTDCYAEDPVQSCYHCDGSWTGHAQKVDGLVYLRCTAVRAGARCHPDMVDKYRCGFYGMSGTYIDCEAVECAIGFGHGCQLSGGLVVKGCKDTGSGYGMIAAYTEPGARIEFTSVGATRQAFVGQVTGNGSLDLTLIDPPKNAITFGRTIRIPALDCPNHTDQASKYDKLPYTVNRSAITINAAEKPAIEEWKTSTFKGVYQFLPLVVEEQPPAVPDTPEVPPIVLPPEPQPHLLSEDGCIKTVLPDGTKLMLVGGGFMDDDAAAYFPHGTIWRRVSE